MTVVTVMKGILPSSIVTDKSRPIQFGVAISMARCVSSVAFQKTSVSPEDWSFIMYLTSLPGDRCAMLAWSSDINRGVVYIGRWNSGRVEGSRHG